MAEDILKIENVSKIYKLGEINTGSLSTDLQRWISQIRGKGHSSEQIAEVNDRSVKSSSGYVWSLKDVSFSVKQGEVFGIIGKNGAGKSTLLKLLSKITKPSKGIIKIDGRIASLLEVGTGFHPDLSGRENVYLNGAILGMRKQEIKACFDEIVAFSGIERYIDTPVKRYSSGMYVRLAFAVAAHLQQEILIIDEVLAVGDAEFQQKCLGKMQDVSKNQGRTVIFVSHNIAAIKQLCSRAMLLEKGQTKLIGSVESVLEVYQESEKDMENGERGKLPDNGKGYFTGWKLEDQKPADLHSCFAGDDVHFSLNFTSLVPQTKCEVCLRLLFNDGTVLLLARSNDFSGQYFSIAAGQFTFNFTVNLPVKPGKYELQAAFLSEGKFIDEWVSSTRLKIMDDFKGAYQDIHSGILNIKTDFRYQSLEKLQFSIS